jgi:energy-coupling factor transport system ATP-binding protein
MISSQELLTLRDVTVTHPGAGVPVLAHVDLAVEEGELILVSGPTGSGKSTLLGAVSGLVPRFSGGTLAGDVLLDGRSIVHAPPRERAAVIGYVGQDPAAGFVTDTVEEELAYGMEQLGLAPATMRRRVEETLDLLGIADLRSRDLRTLSGGQQQRAAIGSVLTMHPRLLVLDEPTSALDPTAAEEVLATLTRLVHDLGVSVLLAEHRLERVVPFADRIALLDGTGGVRVGEPADVLAASPVVPPIVELGRALGWAPLPLTVRDARRRARGVDLRGPDVQPRDPDVEPRDRDVERPLSASNVTVVRGQTPALREVSLDLRAGTVTALMGRNGAGKSTLLWTLQGSQQRRSGTVAAGGKDPAGLDPAQRRAHVGLLPQTAADLLYLETVAEECRAGGPDTRAILDLLVPGIPDDRHPRDLSEGQRLAVALALVLAGRPAAVLLDEPTRGLDYAAKRQLATMLRKLAADGHAVLVATHDVEFTAEVADEVLVLADGEVVSSGPVRRVIAESPAFAPQVTKILGAPWLNVDEVVAALRPTPTPDVPHAPPARRGEEGQVRG